jgi:hypothetical protein
MQWVSIRQWPLEMSERLIALYAALASGNAHGHRVSDSAVGPRRGILLSVLVSYRFEPCRFLGCDCSDRCSLTLLRFGTEHLAHHGRKIPESLCSIAMIGGTVHWQ